MKINCLVIFVTFLFPAYSIAQTVISGFIAPDTVCVNNPVKITNTTSGASSYYWNFCVADANSTIPAGNNLGNINSALNLPVFIDYVYDNGNYYGFVTNNLPGKLVRLDFGNSLLNTPVAVNLGTLPDHAEGIQLIKNEGNWYAIIVGGNPVGYILKIDFGVSIANTSPTITNWGNVGNLAYPVDLHVFKDGNNWHGFTVNAVNNTVTRFDFTTSFNNIPTGVNLGNLGGLDFPTGIYAINNNNNWHVFITNAGSGGSNSTNASITRLDFGSSLLNVPSAVNLGNIGNTLRSTRDIYIYKDCNNIIGFVTNYSSTNDIVKLNFNNNLTGVPSAVSIGNIGNLDFPHCLSKIFRVNNDLYSFITNVNNNTISRLKFTGCNNSSTPSSTAQNPLPVTYNTPGVYNINLTVDDGLPTQDAICRQVVVVAPPPHSPTQNISICGGASIKIGSVTHPATYLWNTGATSDSIVVNTPGTYWVETSHYGCSSIDSFIVSLTSGPPMDFSFQQNMCAPKTVQFTSDLSAVQSYQWNFGNGQTNTISQEPIVSYSDFDSYTIKLKVQYESGCTDSLIKSISIDTVFDNSIVLNRDTTICLGDSILLKTNNSILNYCWRVSEGAAPVSLTDYVKPVSTTTYAITSQIASTNLVTNSDFSTGNSGFTSDYNFVASNSSEGQYWVGSNASSWNAAFANCGDHTSGSGNMMVINSATTPGVKIWSQTISVLPNTNYNFSAWISSLTPGNPADVQLVINGVNFSKSVTAASSSCQWSQVFSSWNSGNKTTAAIAIINKNVNAAGNDFALDDIFFGETTTKTDSFTVNVTGLCDSVKIIGADKVCSPNDTLLYSIYKPGGCTQQYSLQVDNTFANIVSQTPTSVKLIFTKNGSTTIKVAYANSCKIVIDSMDVRVKFSPAAINLGPDIITCKDSSFLLNAGDGFASYLWQSGTTDSTLFVTAPGTYSITAQNLCGIQYRDTFHFIKSIVNPFAVSPVTASVCQGDSIRFSASGGTGYSWWPAINFDTPDSSSTKALIDASQDFTLSISDSVCARDTVITIPVYASPGPVISISKSNDVSCGNDSAILIANGGLAYTWTPDLYISRLNADKITVKPPQTITYYVMGKDAIGCPGEDSVTVYFSKTGDQKLYMPNAFTPNGDGLNDVFRPTFIGPAAKYDFRIYNRWGQLIFRTKTPGIGWDGTYKSQIQASDVYVYYITAEGGCNGVFVQKGTFVLIR